MLKDFRRGGGIRVDEPTQGPFAALVHPSLLEAPPLTQLRAKALSLTGLLFAVLITPLAIVHFSRGHTDIGFIGLFMVTIGLGTAIVIKRHGSVHWAGNLLCFSITVGLAIGILQTGYLHPYASRWLALIPAIATLFGGARMGLGWFFATFALGLALALGLPPDPFAPKEAYYSGVTYSVMTLTLYMTLITGMIGGAEWLRERAFKKLEKEKQHTQVIMDHFSDGIATFDSSCELVDANPTALRLFDEFGLDALVAFAREVQNDTSRSRSLWSRDDVYLDIECVRLHPDIEPEELAPSDAMWLMAIRDVTAARDGASLRGCRRALPR